MKDLTKEHLTFEQSLEGGKGARHRHLRKNSPGRAFYRYKKPEVSVCLACSRNCKEPSVPGKIYVRESLGR